MTIEELIRFIRVSTRHKTLYHFTDETNFPSIREHGLLSKEMLRERELWPPQATGGNQLSWQLDLRRGIDQYVSLCMTRNHPMQFLAHSDGRLPNPRYLAIDPDVLQTLGTKIALGVANANDVEIIPVAEAIGRLDVEVLYTRTDWTDPAVNARLRLAEKFEVLIPNARAAKTYRGSLLVASRPVFIPNYDGASLVQERTFDFAWSPGFAESQKKKNVAALHAAAKQKGFKQILEISSKSDEEIGRRLSAFSLKIEISGSNYPLESVYQGSKVFDAGGPSPEIFDYEPREAKRYMREIDRGRLLGFELEGRRYPLFPKNAFYDWLYLRALAAHVDWINEKVSYDAYTDIEFNPEKQINCQARAFAEYKSLAAKSKLEAAVRDFDYFASLLPPV